MNRWLSAWVVILCIVSTSACAQPIVESWSREFPGGASAVAAAELAGWYAVADTSTDTVEVRDIRQVLMRTISRDEISAFAPWMTLDSSSDGPVALAWTDSGRSLFIVITDASIAPDGLGSDVVLRYDTTRKTLERFARAEIGEGSGSPHAAMHYRGELWITTESTGVRVYRAERNDTAGTLLYSWSLPGGAVARGFALARSIDLAFVISDIGLYRIDLTASFASPVFVGAIDGGRAVAFSDHYGAPEDQGVYLVKEVGPSAGTRVLHIPTFQATGLLAFHPTVYLESADELLDIAATACGRLFLASESGPRTIRDASDTRLDYETWLQDEFAQIVRFGAELVAPDGEPSGWVIDADVRAGGTRFHPATPDAAAWVILLHIARDSLAMDEASVPLVRAILRRYAGHMPDGIGPNTTPDGQFRHWINPEDGGIAPGGWNPEFATLSTMKIVLAADRARKFYANDAILVSAADAIMERVEQWDAYIQPGNYALYFVAQASGGPQAGSESSPFHEGILFVEQAAAFGSSGLALERWLDRSTLPSAEFVAGLPVTTGSSGVFQPAFVTLYSGLLQRSLRDDSRWIEDIRHLLASYGAWTDDYAPRYMTVFSAGTTKPEWGGYHADSLTSHPGDVTTFPAMMGFGALGETAPSVGAYHAYRHGARQTFASGASILYRRADADPNYEPADAGLPDVALGGLGLAELIRPGTLDAVLALAYEDACQSDFAEPFGVLDFFDVLAFLRAFADLDFAADLTGDGDLNFFDVARFLHLFEAGCP